MNFVPCEEAKCIQKLLKLSDQIISNKKKKLHEQGDKLKEECRTLIQRKRYLYSKEKNVAEDLKKHKLLFNQIQTLWNEKSLMQMELTMDKKTFNKEVGDGASKQYFKSCIGNILRAKKQYAKLQSIFDVEKLKLELSKLDIEMSMFDSDIDEMSEKYKILCMNYESEDEVEYNRNKLVLLIKSLLKNK